MSLTPRRSPRVSLPPRTREFNPLESHSRGGGCLPWLMVIGAGLITGTLLAFAMLYFANAPLPFLPQANSATASPMPEAPVANAAASVTVAAALSPPTALPTFTPKPSATQTPTPADIESPTYIAAPSERTATPIPVEPTATLAPSVTPTLGGDLQALKIEYLTNPPVTIFATKRTFTFYVTFQNPSSSDYAITWGVALYPASNPSANSPFGQSSPIKTALPSGVSRQPSGTYQLQSGGEQVCFVARVYQVKDDNPLTVMSGAGQNLNFCVGAP